MDASKPKVLKTDKMLRAFVHEVTATLCDGKPYKAPGFGTFSVCTRKATATRAACRMAMFRAGAELREFAAGGPPPPVTGSHAEVLKAIAEAMQNEQGVQVPLLGRMAAVPVPGKKPRLIFHGARELNHALSSETAGPG